VYARFLLWREILRLLELRLKLVHLSLCVPEIKIVHGIYVWWHFFLLTERRLPPKRRVRLSGSCLVLVVFLADYYPEDLISDSVYLTVNYSRRNKERVGYEANVMSFYEIKVIYF
jgi:hypothetical protein